MKKPFSVILPCFQETRESVAKTLSILRLTLGPGVEYIILEQGPDPLLRPDFWDGIPWGADIRYFYRQKKGLGWAQKMGIKESTYEDIFFFGADLPIDSAKFVSTVQDEFHMADIVSASKQHPKSVVIRPFYRKAWTALSTFGLKLYYRGLPSSDPGSAGRYFRKSKVLSLLEQCPSDGLFFDSQLLKAAEKHGLILAEVPCEVHDLRPTTTRWLRPSTEQMKYLASGLIVLSLFEVAAFLWTRFPVLPWWISYIVSFEVLTMLNFGLFERWVFKSRATKAIKSVWRRLLTFQSQAIGYRAVQYVSFFVLQASIGPYLGLLGAALVGTIYGYTASTRLTWKRSQRSTTLDAPIFPSEA